LYYWAHYDFFNDTKFGTAIPDTVCDEEFVSWKPSSGYFRSPVNTLVYKRQGTVTDPDAKSQPIICRYKFTTDVRLFARIVLKIESIKFKVFIFVKYMLYILQEPKKKCYYIYKVYYFICILYKVIHQTLLTHFFS